MRPYLHQRTMRKCARTTTMIINKYKYIATTALVCRICGLCPGIRSQAPCLIRFVHDPDHIFIGAMCWPCSQDPLTRERQEHWLHDVPSTRHPSRTPGRRRNKRRKNAWEKQTQNKLGNRSPLWSTAPKAINEISPLPSPRRTLRVCLHRHLQIRTYLPPTF